MAIVTYPSNMHFTAYTLKLSRKTIKMESPFTGARQTLASAYALWVFSGKYSMMDTTLAANMRSFLLQLKGQVNRFRLPIPEYVAPSTGYAGAAGLVNGASQTGSSLITDGWTAGASLFNPGDYIVINDETKIINTAVSANGSGQATLAFDPPLRASPANDLALVINNPTILMAAATDDVASWDLTPPILYSFQLDAIEALS